MISSTWLPVSATECTDSASRDVDPLTRKAMNLTIAMPRLAASAANLGIAIVKFIALLVSGSTSLLAESVHSVADTGNQVLLIIGRGRSDRPPSEEHPFGFGRERYFYGFV